MLRGVPNDSHTFPYHRDSTMPHVQLTAVFIEKLKPSGEQVEYFDKGAKGLSLRANQDGTKSWRFSYTFKDKLRRKTLGRYRLPDRGLAWARSERDKAQGKVADGVDPYAEDATQDADDKFAFDACIERFIAEYIELQNKRADEGARILRKEFVPVWGARDIRTIQRSDVRAVLQAILDRGSPVSSRAALSRIRKFFNWFDDTANEADRLTVNPCYRLKPLAKERPRERVLSDKELAAVWRAGEVAGYPHGILIQLLCLLGQRRGEVASMALPDLDLGKAIWTIPAHVTKNGKVHVLPLPQLAVQIIKFCLDRDGTKSGFIFPSRDHPEKYLTGYSVMKRKIDAISGVKNWVPHDLRRTMATAAPDLGISETVIEYIHNHTLPRGGNVSGTSKVYNRNRYLTQMREALEAWAAFVVKLKR